MDDHPTRTTEDCPNGACPGRMMCLDCSETADEPVSTRTTGTGSTMPLSPEPEVQPVHYSRLAEQEGDSLIGRAAALLEDPKA